MLDLTDRTAIFYWQTDRTLTPQQYSDIFLARQDVDKSVLARILQDGISEISPITSLRIIDPDENVVLGNVNIVRHVEINGTVYVVRMHPMGVQNGYFHAERAAIMAAAHTKAPVPEVIDIHEARDERDMDFMLMTRAPGVSMTAHLKHAPADEDELLVQCGAMMGHIHSVRVEGFGPFDNAHARETGSLKGLHSTYTSFIHAGLEENLQRLISYAILTENEAAALAAVFEHTSYELAHGARLVHNDFADWNVLVDGQDVTAILDWDECHAGDPVADLACWSTFFDIERMGRLLDGYHTTASLPDDYEDRFQFYRLRYTISKMALRAKRYEVDTSPFVREKLEIGKRALSDAIKRYA